MRRANDQAIANPRHPATAVLPGLVRWAPVRRALVLRGLVRRGLVDGTLPGRALTRHASRWSGRTTSALVLAGSLSACAPWSSAPPAAPPAELAPVPVDEEPAEIVVARGPELPPPPTVSGERRGPLEMGLPVAGEVSADHAGVLRLGEGSGDASAGVHWELRPCRFAHAEPGFTTDAPDGHCRDVNQTTMDERAQRALVLSPGTWVVTVTNDAFDRELGLWLRSTEAPEVPIISAGGIARGESRQFTVALTPGEYIYSCPLSPTPDYTLIVR